MRVLLLLLCIRLKLVVIDSTEQVYLCGDSLSDWLVAAQTLMSVTCYDVI